MLAQFLPVVIRNESSAPAESQLERINLLLLLGCLLGRLSCLHRRLGRISGLPGSNLVSTRSDFESSHDLWR